MVDLRCPDCERPVYVEHYNKQRFDELRSVVRPEGVEAFVQSCLKGFDPPPKRLGPGAFRVEVAGEQVTLCVVEYADQKYLTREHALEHRSVFVVVNDRDLDQRFLDEDWVVRTTLAEVICGVEDIEDLICSAVVANPPSLIRQVSIPICDRRPLAVVTEPLTSPAPARRFVVEVGPKVVRIDGLKVVAEQAGPRFRIFRRLWEVFLEDLGNGLAPEKFRPVPLRELMRQIETSSGEPYDDETSARRVINRLQQDIETAIKKHLGVAIGREDIVQTIRWQDQLKDDYGYRLNPFSVAVRPFQ
jgi:hypothetical protein